MFYDESTFPPIETLQPKVIGKLYNLTWHWINCCNDDVDAIERRFKDWARWQGWTPDLHKQLKLVDDFVKQAEVLYIARLHNLTSPGQPQPLGEVGDDMA